MREKIKISNEQPEYIKNVLERYGLIVKNQFTEGGRCKNVYLVERANQELVLKISNIPNEAEEIRKNIVGYKLMSGLGLDFFIPKLHAIDQQKNCSFILMEHIGENLENFMHRDKNNRNYLTLTDSLKNVCKRSLHKPNQPVLANSLDIFCGLSTILKRESVISYLPKGINFKTIDQFFRFPLKRMAFSSLDLEPRNIFFKNGVVKHADPQDRVIGIPIVDFGNLACMIKDVAKLPDCEFGYDSLFRSVDEMGQILELSHAQSQGFFHLARLLQSLRGINHFHNLEDIIEATKLASFAKERFQSICELFK